MIPDKRVEEIVGFIYRANKSMYNSPEAKEADLRRFIATTLTKYHQDIIREVVEELEGAKRVPAIGYKDKKIFDFTTEVDKAHNQALTEAQTIIKSK